MWKVFCRWDSDWTRGLALGCGESRGCPAEEARLPDNPWVKARAYDREVGGSAGRAGLGYQFGG
jgi:hypothetical protein